MGTPFANFPASLDMLYISTIEDTQIEEELQNLERLIEESWEWPDSASKISRDSSSTLASTLALSYPEVSIKEMEETPAQPTGPPAEQNLPKGWKLFTLCICLCTAVFLQALV